MNIVLFDLYGTLVEKEHYDYDKGLAWLSSKYFENKLDELRAVSAEVKFDYIRKRKNSDDEISFCKQLIQFEERLNIKIPETYDKVEFDFICIFRKEKLIKGVREVLQFLHENGQQIYIVTNSIFSGKNLKTYLRRYGIDFYIKKVYSSADIGYRKPSEKIFEYILDDLQIRDVGKVYYIGDSIEKDYEGAKKVGLIPIILGNCEVSFGLVFKDMEELMKYCKKIYTK